MDAIIRADSITITATSWRFQAYSSVRCLHLESRNRWAPASSEFSSQRQSAGEPRLEIQYADPFGSDRDPNHGRNHLSHLRNPSLSLFTSEVALGRDRVFGHDALHGLHARGASNQQHFVRKSIIVDG